MELAICLGAWVLVMAGAAIGTVKHSRRLDREASANFMLAAQSRAENKRQKIEDEEWTKGI